MTFILSLLLTLFSFSPAQENLLMQVSPDLLQPVKIPAERIIYVDSNGIDTNNGKTPQSAVRTIKQAQKILSNEKAQLFIINVGIGNFTVIGEWSITKPTRIFGAGMNKTKLNLKLKQQGNDPHKWDAGIRIQSKKVQIHDLTINSNTIAKDTSIGGGGRAEYGTGITIGNYLEKEPLAAVSNIKILRVRIERTNGFSGPGISILGRASKITIKDVEINGANSTAIIMHWGGYNSEGRSPLAFKSSSYKLYRSYHPNNISISNLKIDNARRGFIISGCHDVSIKNVTGKVSALLTVLPGDELNLYALKSEKEKINSNININTVEVDVFNYSIDTFISISSQGTSKVDYGIKRLTEFKNFLINNVRVKNYIHDSTKALFSIGIKLFKAQGINNSILLRNIDLNKIIRPNSSGRALAVNSSKEITLNNIRGFTSSNITNNNNQSVIWNNVQIRKH